MISLMFYEEYKKIKEMNKHNKTETVLDIENKKGKGWQICDVD